MGAGQAEGCLNHRIPRIECDHALVDVKTKALRAALPPPLTRLRAPSRGNSRDAHIKRSHQEIPLAGLYGFSGLPRYPAWPWHGSART